MRLNLSFVFCITLASMILVSGWKSSETEEFNEDSLPVVTSPWMETNVDKRNTWWTKKSVPVDQKPKICHFYRCFVLFKECSRRAENISVLAQCKESQFACLDKCLRGNIDVLMNTSAMTS